MLVLLLFFLWFLLTKHCHLMGIIFCISYSNDRSFKMCWFMFCHSIIFGMLMKRNCDANHKNVKMRSRSSYTCQTDMYTLQYSYRPNIVDLWLAVIEELTMMKMWHKSPDRENEVTIKWHLPDWQCIYRPKHSEKSCHNCFISEFRTWVALYVPAT